MPLLYDEPEPDLVGLGEGLATMRLPSSLAWSEIYKDSQLTGRVGDFLQVDAARSFDAKMRRMTGYSDQLDPEEANERFGLEGSLKFDRPVLEVDAAWQQRRAREREFKDYVLANSDIGFLDAAGAAMAGTLMDPISWPLMFAPELLGLGKLTQAAVGVRGGMAALKAGRLANAGRFAAEGFAEGAVGGALYEAALNMPLRRVEGEDYRFGDALRNIAMGAVFGAGAKGLLGAMLPPARRAGEAADPEAVALAEDIDGLPDTVLPEAVERLPESQRSAAAALAIDRMADDAPVDMGPVFEQQAKATLASLDEVPGQPGTLAARYLGEDVAVSTRGTEIPVRYALVEVGDLITSHDDDLVRNGDYPGALQPRDRGERAGSIAANRGLQGRLHPKLLLEAVSAETGSPIVSRDGVVESGNGRLIAMRRDAAEGGKFWEKYQEALAAAGYDVGDLQQPVLVRVRDNALSGEERAALARELNPSMTEQMGPREQAMADAAAMPADVLEKLSAGPVDGAANGPFARAFLEALAPDQLNSMVDSAGRLSKDGADRLRAAVMAVAYGDGGLLEAVFEQADGHLKGIGQALADAAPAWARMRADMARGLTPPELDLTGNIKAAVDLVRHAREQRMALGRLMAERRGQLDAFGGSGLSPETEALLRLFYDNKGMTKPRDPALVAAFLDDYARQAQAKTPGPDLFGETHDGAARQILEHLGERLAKGAGEFGDVLARLRVEQATDARPDAAGHAGAVLFDADGPDGVGGRRGPGVDAEGAGGRVDDAAAERFAADADLADDLSPEAAAEKLAPVIEVALAKPGKQAKAAMGGVSGWLREALGLKGSWRHTVDASAVKHVLKNHGDAAVEQSRGQIAVTADDLARTPEVYGDPDRVITGATNKLGRPIVGYIKQMDDGSWLLLEEIRKGRYELALDSLRKYPATTNVEAITSTLRPNARSDGGDVLNIVDRPREASPASPSRPAQVDAAQGEKAGEPAAPPAQYGQAFIQADPELLALFEDTQAMLAREGLDGAPVAPARDPDTIATAMRTAALCLLDAAEDL